MIKPLPLFEGATETHMAWQLAALLFHNYSRNSVQGGLVVSMCLWRSSKYGVALKVSIQDVCHPLSYLYICSFFSFEEIAQLENRKSKQTGTYISAFVVLIKPDLLRRLFRFVFCCAIFKWSSGLTGPMQALLYHQEMTTAWQHAGRLDQEVCTFQEGCSVVKGKATWAHILYFHMQNGMRQMQIDIKCMVYSVS